MKYKLLTVTSVFGGITLSTALGIEPRPENAVPPSAILGQAVEKNSRTPQPLEVEKESSVPFVGFSTAPLPEMVADHVGLDANSAVIIRTVMPGSPAAKAGLSANDIVLTANEKVVTQPEQLSSIILSHKPGERLDLDLIHKGKPAKVTVTLGERPAKFAANPPPQPLLEGLSNEHAERLRSMIEQNIAEFEGDPLGRMQGQMSLPFANKIPQPGQTADSSFQFQQNSTVRMMDSEGAVEINSSKAGTLVTVRDSSGKIVWTGPWDTEQDKAAAPDSIRERVQKINFGGAKGFQLHFGQR